MKSDMKFMSDLVIEYVPIFFFSFSLVLFPALNQLKLDIFSVVGLFFFHPM